MRVHAAAAALRPPLGGRALDRRPRRRAGPALRRARRGHGRVALAAPAPARHDATRRAPRDLPAPARPVAHARATRASSCRTCASSASATSTSRRCCRRGAARRTATTSSTRARVSDELGGEHELRALCEAGLERAWTCSTSSRTTWRPTTQNPFWRDPELRERFFDVDHGHRPAPALLRRRRARRASRVEEPEVFETTHRFVLDLVAEGLVDGLRIDHPDGLADPRGYLERLRAEGVERIWVEKILEPGERLRDWPVEGTTGYEFLNDVAGALRRPGRRGGADRARRRAAALARASPPRRSSSRRRRRSSPRSSGCAGCSTCPTSSARSRRCPSTAPTSSRGAAASRTPTARRSPGCRTALRRVLLLEERGHDEFVTRFQQTTGAGDGEGRRGHGVLPLRAPARAERGRRRSRAASGSPSRRSTARTPQRADRFPRHAARRDDARHEAQRRRARAHRRARRAWPSAWREARPPLARAERAAPRRRRARLDRGAARLPDARRRLADRARTGSSRYLEKALREAKRNTSWVEPERALGGRGRALRDAALLTHEPFLADFEPFAARARRAPARARRSASSCCGSPRPGVPGHLQRRRAAVPRARRPRQPPARRLGRPPRRARLARCAARRLGEAARDPRGARAARAAGPRRSPGRLRAARRPARARARSAAASDVVVAVPVRGDEPELELPPRPLAQRARGLERALGGYRVLLLERR